MITVRLAEERDCKNVFLLSTMDYVRKNSFNTEKILWENHVEWFKKALTSEKIKFFIIEEDGFIGQVRLSVCGSTAAVSISLLEEFQHKGYAYFAMKKIIDEHSYHYLAQIKKIISSLSDCLNG